MKTKLIVLLAILAVIVAVAVRTENQQRRLDERNQKITELQSATAATAECNKNAVELLNRAERLAAPGSGASLPDAQSALAQSRAALDECKALEARARAALKALDDNPQ
jgi:hypothetical protein